MEPQPVKTAIRQLPEYSESELESRIIDHLQQFLLELGTGFAFMGRQVRFTFDEEHFIVDLVFYNRLLRCFVLFEKNSLPNNILQFDQILHPYPFA